MTASEEALRRPSAWWILLPAGIAELALLGALGWWPGASGTWARLLLFGAAFAVYALAASRVLDTAGGHVLVWIFAILMRLVLLPLTPELSHDAYRYLWDGHVQLAGINPYRFAPGAVELSELRTAYHPLIADPGVHTIYPPAAQLAFFVIALAGGALLQAKILWLGLDLGTAWLLTGVARITGRSRRLTQVLYLWSPLLLVEVAWNGHLAPLGLFATVLVILLARAPAGAGAAMAFAGLAELAPFMAVPALVRRLGGRFAIGFLVASALLCAPYVTAGSSLFAGLGAHLRQSDFMSGPFALLEAVLPGTVAPRYAAAALLIGVVAWAAAARMRPERALFWILGAALLLTPTLHPWYVLWLLPFAALRVSRPWILLSGTAFVGYVGLDASRTSGAWPQPVWARLVLWLPFLALLVLDAARWWRERVPPAQPLSEPE